MQKTASYFLHLWLHPCVHHRWNDDTLLQCAGVEPINYTMAIKIPLHLQSSSCYKTICKEVVYIYTEMMTNLDVCHHVWMNQVVSYTPRWLLNINSTDGAYRYTQIVNYTTDEHARSTSNKKTQLSLHLFKRVFKLKGWNLWGWLAGRATLTHQLALMYS